MMGINRNDILLTAAVLLVAAVVLLAFFLNSDDGKTALVSVDGDAIYTLSLEKETEKTVETQWGTNIVKVEKGEISVSFADCRDKICQNHRAISKTGETIVCLPHKLVVEII